MDTITRNANDLIRHLRGKQERSGASDREFAKALGISNGQWSGVKSGRIGLGRNTLRAIKATFPDLGYEVDAYWLSLLEAEAEVA